MSDFSRHGEGNQRHHGGIPEAPVRKSLGHREIVQKEDSKYYLTMEICRSGRRRAYSGGFRNGVRSASLDW
jgi:hypothetical protein